MMKVKEFIERLISIASDYKTIYVNGTWGWVMNQKNKERACKTNQYNISHKSIIFAAPSDSFGFDCCGLIKGVLWGWNGDLNSSYGGAGYACNGVPDLSEAGIINACSNVSTDFSKIKPGEAVHMNGHIGVYIGDGLAVEATPAWENKVQITACNCDVPGYHRRNWTRHGFMPWIDYTEVPDGKTPVDITYQVYAGNRWLPNVVNQNDYAGVFNNPISGIYADASLGNLTYCVHIMKQDNKEGYWEEEVVNREDYAGILGKPIDAFMIKSDVTTVHYKVHLKGGSWQPAVTGYNKNDEDNGYAGVFGKEIDALYIWADPFQEEKKDEETVGTTPTNPTNGDEKTPSEEEEPDFLICPLCGAYMNMDGDCQNPLCKNNPDYKEPVEDPVEEDPVDDVCPECGKCLKDGKCTNIHCVNCEDYRPPIENTNAGQQVDDQVGNNTQNNQPTVTGEYNTSGEIEAFKEIIKAICNFFVSLFKKLFRKDK